MSIVSDKSVGFLETMFTFGEGDLAYGCVDTQLLMPSGAGLMVGWLVKLPNMMISKKRTSERVEFRPFRRATEKACCSRTSS